MLRDVFYFKNKPNAHPKEKFAVDIQDARNQAKTEHFWIINEHCDYRNFDWDFDFDVLPDEDVWAGEHINVWPSHYQKDSGTWLCNKNDTDIIIYRTDVNPIPLKNEIVINWKILEDIDYEKFDFKWHPDPTDPPYIYVFGNQWYPGTIMPTVEYHVVGATDRKFVTDTIAWLSQKESLFKTIHPVVDFDYSWRPNPTSPPYIYVFGNTQYPGNIMPTVEYHVPGATDIKYIEDIISKLAPQPHKFTFHEDIDMLSFDFSWVPDPTSPPYIYVWGNQWNKPEDKISLSYKVDGATEYKYMDTKTKRMPNKEFWQTPFNMIHGSFDFSWEPNPHDPPYIYMFGTQWQNNGGPAYVIPGATEKKYVSDIRCKVNCKDLKKWLVPKNIDITSFDFGWHPDENDPPYIYQFSDQWSRSGGPRYVVENATEIKYIDTPKAVAKIDMTHWRTEHCVNIDLTSFDFSWHPDIEDKAYIYKFGTQHQKTGGPIFISYGLQSEDDVKYIDVIKAKALDNKDNFIINDDIVDFDYSWHPDETEPPYIYVWGNKHYGSDLKPTVEYHIKGATQIKHMSQDVKLAESNKLKIYYNIDRNSFDTTFRPDPTSPPYIYVWGNKHVPGTLAPTVEFYVDGATEYKFVNNDIRILPDFSRWKIVQDVDIKKFDFTWLPNPKSPPYIYVWGNKFIPGELLSTIEYHVPNATEYKYMDELVEVVPEIDRWVITHEIDTTKFDLTWRPDPREPPYIYVWGNKFIPGEKQPTLEYYCPGANERKYMGNIEVLPELNKWTITHEIDTTKFDLSWRPDPNEPPYIYVWGNKHIQAELQPTLEYHTPTATERKYMGNVEVLPELSRWVEVQPIKKDKFDLTWRPDPREPPYVYVWGNKHIPAELKSTIEYHTPNAVDKKYMGDVEVLPLSENYKIIQPTITFDYTWRPDPREPDYIYVWGNEFIPAEIKPTIEYHCPGATERKYMGNIEVAPEWDKYKILIPIDKNSFNFAWRPDPREPPYIYVWGNQSYNAEVEPTIEYHCIGATERKYMNDQVASTLPDIENFKILIPVSEFNYSWRPDPHSPPYIYVFGNQWHDAITEPTIEYHVPGATERKYVTDIVAKVSATQEHWKTLLPVDNFDYSWRPDPHSPPYIYVFGNQWNPIELEHTVEYHTPGATEKKYITNITAFLKQTNTDNKWKQLIPIESFDYSWRPDPREPALIFVFGNKWNDAETEPTIEYHCVGATERKYMNYPVAIPKTDLQYWSISNNDDLNTFDFSWRPNPYSPPQIYQWEDNGPTYTTPGATHVVLMKHNENNRKAVVNRYKINTTIEDLINEHPNEVFWALNPDLNYDKFDFNWRPTEENFRHINVFGNQYSKNTQTYYINGPMYQLGHREFNYIEDTVIETDTNLSMFFIDRGNPESSQRFVDLKTRYPKLQKTRFLNNWVDTITRCIVKSETKLFYVLNSELDYTDFVFDFYPSPWQEKMVHVFGTQWSHWGNTYLVNKEKFLDDTKYVKVIEHLPCLNFVKTRKAKAVNVLYDIVYINHGNLTEDQLSSLQNQGKIVANYDTNYLKTFNRILEKLPNKKEHYIWVVSSICNYDNFDFTYICDPFAKDQLHVFPSDKQKFGDTFLVDVNKLRLLISDMQTLEDYVKVNFNQHQRVPRLPAPEFVIYEDTLVNCVKNDYNFPYAIFKTNDNRQLDFTDYEPISLWNKESKNIVVTSTGGTRLIVPKEAKEYVKRELYNYPYITKASKLIDSNPMDIIFVSNGESCAEKTYNHLLQITKKFKNRIVRVDGINGRTEALHHAAKTSSTPWFYSVPAKLLTHKDFDFKFQPDRLQIPKHYIFNAHNPVNNLYYGHQAMVLYNSNLVLATTGTGLDFTLESEHESVDLDCGIAIGDTDEYSTWRTAFREAVKLQSYYINKNDELAQKRLSIWTTIGKGTFGQWSIIGAKDGLEFFAEVNGELSQLRQSYYWDWLYKRFKSKY